MANGATLASSFDALPDEILQLVLFHLSPQDTILNVQRVSKRLHRLGNGPLLWRYHCRVQFRYWDAKHRIRQKFRGSVGDVDWKMLYTHRKKVDIQTTQILDSILEDQVNRIKKFASIGEFGYDAKDTLVRHCRTRETAEDVLARRYYATAALDYVHRSEALAEWSKLAKGETVPLERALGSFDLFVLHDNFGDLLEICDLFDNLANRIRQERPDLDQMSHRGKAFAVVKFLRMHNLTGIDSDSAYRDLQNNYIGIALQDVNHPSLPLLSVAIFCGLASRLGLDARCCGMPGHAHAMVFPDSTSESNGANTSDSEAIYLDPYRSDQETPVVHLLETLASWGIQPTNYSRYISDSTIPTVVLRTCRNILATVHEFGGQGANTSNPPTIRLYANPFADMENAFYSALWANFMLTNVISGSRANNQQQFIPLILGRFERLYPMDASLIEQYICPLYNNPSNPEHWGLHEALRVVRAADQSPRQLKPRNTRLSRERVKYKVGQVFRHRRYNYTAVITGWDIECGMNSDWIVQNQVDSLSRGRFQSFYHSLVEDTSIRYVAEENLEIITPENPKTLMALAGRFFKRWDNEKRVFVSNIRDEYPDD